MKIQKIGFALGSQKKTIKSLVSRNYERIIKTTGISKIFHVSDKEDIISLATKASKKVLSKEKKLMLLSLLLKPQNTTFHQIVF